ncbi:MAG: AmmeMemoRadiSam system protein A [Campylobacterales bacterium]
MHPYLAIARDAILERLTHKNLIDHETLLKNHPELASPGATFVTLTRQGQLRGCIGSLIAHRPLLDDLINNARAAAFEDPRFAPLDLSEWPQIEIEVSLLNQPQPLSYESIEDLKTTIRPGVDGVILHYRGHQATFLPQVWDELPDFDHFFGHLCQKAGLPANCLLFHPDLYTYQVTKITNNTHHKDR